MVPVLLQMDGVCRSPFYSSVAKCRRRLVDAYLLQVEEIRAVDVVGIKPVEDVLDAVFSGASHF
ncbi:MAG: hypothetical protein OEM62_11005 [Acidobacteriota bacterium]|nr:hypothetical protein [Acidobacteriota bacterium]